MGHCAMVKIVVWGWSSQLQEALQPCLFFFGFPWWDNSNGRNRKIPQNRVGSQRDFWTPPFARWIACCENCRCVQGAQGGCWRAEMKHWKSYPHWLVSNYSIYYIYIYIYIHNMYLVKLQDLFEIEFLLYPGWPVPNLTPISRTNSQWQDLSWIASSKWIV